jgi:hypothetical protein
VTAMGIAGAKALYVIEDEVELMTAQQHDSDNHDEEDVKAALEKTDTADGSGFTSEDELPESDFVAFAEDDVEDTEETPK